MHRVATAASAAVRRVPSIDDAASSSAVPAAIDSLRSLKLEGNSFCERLLSAPCFSVRYGCPIEKISFSTVTMDLSESGRSGAGDGSRLAFSSP